MTMTIPVIPPLPAGYVVQLSDMQALANAATFLLTKPVTRARDGNGGLAIGTAATAIHFSTTDIDTDGMWSTGSPDRLTIQTGGWYKVRWMAQCGVGNTFTGWVTSTSGPSNPSGAGITSAPRWAGYADGVATAQASRPGASGVWPFYLYAGDYLQVMVKAAAAGNSTGNGSPGAALQGGSLLTLEYVSTG